MRTAISTHVAEILRDAGSKVMLCRIITPKKPAHILSRRENRCWKSLNPPRFTPENWAGIKDQEVLLFVDYILSARVLRILATNHISKEVSPDVFANNRLSSALDTGKSIEELLTRLVLSLSIYRNGLKNC